MDVVLTTLELMDILRTSVFGADVEKCIEKGE